VLEKEEVVVDQGGQYDDDDEYEGDYGPAFTPPTKPRTGNHGAVGSFYHGVAAVGSRMAVAGGLGDPTGGWRLRPWRPRCGGGRVSRSVRWQRAGLGDLTSSGQLRPWRPRRGGGRVSRGGSGWPQRSGWRWAASTTVATTFTMATRHQWLLARI
jgi:hypothetical protein